MAQTGTPEVLSIRPLRVIDSSHKLARIARIAQGSRMVVTAAVVRTAMLLACAEILTAVAETGGGSPLAFARFPLASAPVSGRGRSLSRRSGVPALACATKGPSFDQTADGSMKDRRNVLQQFGGSVLAAAVAIGAPQLVVAEEEEEAIVNVGKCDPAVLPPRIARSVLVFGETVVGSC
jgi:hypothetical protein